MAKESVKEQTKTHVKLPRQYQVLIYNDDFTPMDFVVEVLMQIFDKEEAAAGCSDDEHPHGKLCGGRGIP